MNKRVLKRMENMIVNHWRLSILFLLLASIFFFVNSQLSKDGIINTWTQALIVGGKIFEYLGFMMIVIPIFEFINLRRDELKMYKLKKIKKLVEIKQKNNLKSSEKTASNDSRSE